MQSERMEDTATEHFNSLVKEGFFVFSRCDFTLDFDSLLWAPADDPSNFLYMVNPSKHSLLEDTISSGNYFKAVDGKLDGASQKTRHLSFIGEEFDEMPFGILQNFKDLRTLHMLSCCGSSMKHVPRDFCFTFTFLKTLNLSGTSISELPSSFGNVKSLRYIDASHTPISRLPESIDSLHHLQTIKLRGCRHFVQLPKGMKKLSNLRHIELDIIRQLDSMPGHLGNLTKQILPAFLVGRADGCRVGELKNLNDLHGSFNISRLENVSSKEEAEEAALFGKKRIHRLELQWSEMFVECAQQEEILEFLQPHSGLKELQIQQYSGSILPSWISNPSFTDLVAITLYRCRNCKLLPCMGQLPALKSLSIIEVNEVKEINHQFFRKGLADHAFPKLERLEVDIMLNLRLWKDVQVGGLPSLVTLTLDSCPELVTLPEPFLFKSLKHLELRCCPKLMVLPTGGLPTSLEFFLLLNCHELKSWCLKIEHWSMFCHVPAIWFDHEEIKGRCGMTDSLTLAQVSAMPAEVQTYTQISTNERDCGTRQEREFELLSQKHKKSSDDSDLSYSVGMQKVVFELDIHDDKSKREVMKTVSRIYGVDSISMDMKDKKLTVVGNIDIVHLLTKLRKLCHAVILSVGPAKKKKEEGQKKEEPKKGDEKKKDPKDEPVEHVTLCASYNPNGTGYRIHTDENPNSCVIC
ncbi:putative disease resistance RPP13-like protein 1 [Argentina anserina]|uniref:putative disease resistance RPP13-like protein 1 n=1 Tax=Argentina anserina TaxID=57926 RepID=UPI0021764432|nr:putative disease resistance RPP13-like protein 1 [Potentilla anserina]